MRVSKRDIVQHLKEERIELSERLEANTLALRAFGIDPDTMRMPRERLPRRHQRRQAERDNNRPRRTLEAERIDNEAIRVLSELGHPAYVEEIFALGDFGDHTVSAIYHAERRNPQLVRVHGEVNTLTGRQRIQIALAEWDLEEAA